jgi:hypothetical protein
MNSLRGSNKILRDRNCWDKLYAARKLANKWMDNPSVNISDCGSILLDILGTGDAVDDEEDFDEFIYDIGFGTCEESEYTQLIHSTEFSKKELEVLVHKALKKAYDTREIPKDRAYDFTQYQFFHDRVIEILCDEYGFRKVEFTAKWSCFGWAEIDYKESWRSYRGEHDTLDRFYDIYIKGEVDT